MEAADGVEVVDDIKNNIYPQPLNATKKDDVEVGRIRQSLVINTHISLILHLAAPSALHLKHLWRLFFQVFGDHGLDLFVCGDQLLRGAALNAVIIAEVMHKDSSEGAPSPAKKAKK